MILVTTAGKVGAEAARLLAARGEPVRVLVRDPEKATALAEAGAEVVQGDLEVPATIDAAMEGVSAVVLVSPADPRPRTERGRQRRPRRRGARREDHQQGLGRLAHRPAARSGRDRARADRLRVGYTLLRNNAYMQNFLMSAPSIAKTRQLRLRGGRRPRRHDRRARRGRRRRADRRRTRAHAGKTYWPTGPESITFAEAAAALSKLLGRSVTFQPLTVEEQTRAMVDVGLPEASRR